MKKTRSKPGLPTIDQSKALVAEYREKQRYSLELNSRIRAMLRALEIENNTYYNGIGALADAISDYEVTGHWPPKQPKEARAK